MAGTSWPNLVAGQKAKASEIELKFDWLEGSLVPMSGGNKTNTAYDLGEFSYRWRDLYIGRYGYIYDDIKLSSKKKFYVDGGVDTYIKETIDGTIAFIANSIETSFVVDSGMGVHLGNKLYFSNLQTIYLKQSSSSFMAYVEGNKRWDIYRYSSYFYGNDISLELTTDIRFHLVGASRFIFYPAGTGQSDAEWTTFSPDIRKDEKYKNKISLTAEDYLNWALDDAKKPNKPYKGLPAVKERENETTTMAHIFATEEEVKEERKKYSKGLGKIAIGTARWAEWANNKIKELETRLQALGG